MQTLRKNIARRPWLLAVLGFMLLAQIQQAIACDLMMGSSDVMGQHCPKHDSSKQQVDPAKNPCCDFSFEFSTAGSCHSDPGANISPSLAGKLQMDYHPAFITASLQDIFPDPQSPSLVLVPDRESSRPGTQTYLATLRLRI